VRKVDRGVIQVWRLKNGEGEKEKWFNWEILEYFARKGTGDRILAVGVLAQ